MAVQIPNFPMISGEDANPFSRGIKSGQDIFSKILEQRVKELNRQKLEAELPFAGEMAKSTAAYKTAMANYLNNPYQVQRFMTPLGKTLNEQRMLGTEGGQGGQNKPIYDIYGNQIVKSTTDPKSRERNLFATNIEKTEQAINPEHLTEYSGIGGLGKYGMDVLKSALSGETPSRLANYKDASRMSEALATQVRQFYGASITPTQMEELNKLTNPSSWKYDQKTAMRLFEKYKNLLNTEMQTYRQAMNSPSIYGFQGQNPEMQTEGNEGNSNNGIQLPTFNTKEEFVQWFNQQPKNVQDVVRQHIGGQ